jgi:D-alanyl-D-alanine carboxypeptidase
MISPNAVASKDFPFIRVRAVAMAAVLIAVGVLVPVALVTLGRVVQIGPAAPAGLPACRVAERPATPTSYDAWAATLVDPAHTLSPLYEPPDLRRGSVNGSDVTLRKFVLRPLVEMLNAAAADGVTIDVMSSYRSYADQQSLVASNHNSDDLVARPGHSEHQLGTTVDLGGGDEWLAANASRFGFVNSYPATRSPTWTCYQAEPWHYRYFGPAKAAAITDSGLSPREYLWLHK